MFNYIQPQLSLYIPLCSLQPLGMGLLDEPQCGTVIGSYAFRVVAPRNGIDYQPVRRSNSFLSSKKCLKTYYFSLDFKHQNIQLPLTWLTTNPQILNSM